MTTTTGVDKMIEWRPLTNLNNEGLNISQLQIHSIIDGYNNNNNEVQTRTDRLVSSEREANSLVYFR